MKHTKEPWRLSYHTVSDDKIEIAIHASRLFDTNFIATFRDPDDEQEACYKRIVACVNACRNIRNPEALPGLFIASILANGSIDGDKFPATAKRLSEALKEAGIE